MSHFGLQEIAYMDGINKMCGKRKVLNSTTWYNNLRWLTMAFPGTYNFNYYAGDTFEFFIYPKNSSGGVFDDLNGYTANFIIATARGSASVVLTSEDEEELLSTIEDGDHVSCTILPDGGRQLTNPSYLYDVQIVNDSNGKVFTLLTGTITVTQDVARI